MIEICDVSVCLHAIDPLVEWNHAYWSERMPEVDRNQWLRFYQECVDTRGIEIPATIVGLQDGQVFGGVTIVKVDDIHDFPEYSPWIAALIVGKEFRGNELGPFLMNAALARARLMGFKEVFLWTDSRVEWYRQQGWNQTDALQFGKVEATIMKHVI